MPGLLLCLYGCLFLHCAKTTTTSGYVYDYKTGKPVEGMYMTLIGYDGNYPHDSTNPNPCETVHALTDAQGRYDLEVDCRGIDKVGLYIGYARRFDLISDPFISLATGYARLNKHTDVDIQVDSVNGKVNFKIYNSQPVDGEINLYALCSPLYDSNFLGCGIGGKINVKAGETVVKSVWFASGRYIKYRWNVASPVSPNQSTNTDSVYCAPHQTVECSISF